MLVCVCRCVCVCARVCVCHCISGYCLLACLVFNVKGQRLSDPCVLCIVCLYTLIFRNLCTRNFLAGSAGLRAQEGRMGVRRRERENEREKMRERGKESEKKENRKMQRERVKKGVSGRVRLDDQVCE